MKRKVVEELKHTYAWEYNVSDLQGWGKLEMFMFVYSLAHHLQKVTSKNCISCTSPILVHCIICETSSSEYTFLHLPGLWQSSFASLKEARNFVIDTSMPSYCSQFRSTGLRHRRTKAVPEFLYRTHNDSPLECYQRAQL